MMFSLGYEYKIVNQGKKGNASAGFSPRIRVARAEAEPQDKVHPRGPWPVLYQRLG